MNQEQLIDLEQKILQKLQESKYGLSMNALVYQLPRVSSDVVREAVYELLSKQLVDLFVDVISPNTTEVLESFSSIIEVPELMRDTSFSGEEFEVDPTRDLSTRIKIHSD